MSLSSILIDLPAMQEEIESLCMKQRTITTNWQTGPDLDKDRFIWRI